MEKCPKCGNNDFVSWDLSAWECDGEFVWQAVTCDQCGFMWNCVYSFSHYEDAETMEVINESAK